MSANGSPNHSTVKLNRELCRAVEKQSILYDLSHEHYRKRLASENCWDLVASETGVSVEKCKRRWRMIRTDYVRWLNQAEHRSNNKGPKKAAYYLSDDLKFLNPHLSLAENVEHEHEHDDRDSSERERDGKSQIKEPILQQSSSTNIAKPKETAVVVEERPQSSKDLKPEGKKIKLEESESKADEAEEIASHSLTSSLDGAAKKKPEFFIKQSNLNSPNCLIIGKKHTHSETPPPSDPLEAMADDSADETASVGGGRRLRRSASRLKQLAIQKPAADQRQTRLQRRKSMSIAAAHSLRSSTSPVKMTPLPRTSLAAASAAATAATAAQPTATEAGQAITVSKSSTAASSTVSASTSSVSASTSSVSASTSSVSASTSSAVASNRDDIFPRPRATAPLSQQLVLARRPGAVNPGQPSPTMPSPPVRHHIGPGRPPGPSRVNTALKANASPVVAKRGAPPQIGVRHIAPSVGQVAVAPAQPRATSSAASSSGNTSSNSSSSGIGSGSTSGSSSGFVVNSTATPIFSASATASSSSLGKQHCERASQTDVADIFSDEHFLDMMRPQMREMNPRQKLHFKQKIFQALMETFDDATDFPGEGQAQHFNINTPSGFEHVSDPELRLMRELVSMVSAAKHTEKLQTAVGGGTPPQAPAAAVPVPVAGQRAQQQGNKIQTHVRIQRPPAGGTNLLPSPVGATVLGDDKKLYRILQMNSNAKIRAMAALQRNDSVDSNGSLGNVVPTRPGTFVVPSSSPKTPTPLPNSLQTLRIQDPLMSLFGAGASQVTGNKLASSKDPLQVRQMGRRYSVCGAGGPISNLSHAGSAASASSSSSSASSASPANAENAQLKRRMAPASQVAVPPQQRVRYSHSPVANQLAGIAPGNSLLVRRAAVSAQKQPSPTAGGSVPQKTPLTSNVQGSSGSGIGSGSAPSAFNAFATPASLRGSNSNLNNVGLAVASPAGGLGISPLKRGMVIANVKGAAQQKQSPAASATAGSAGVSGLRTAVQQTKPSTAPSSSNVANLLGDARPAQRAQTTAARPGRDRKSTGESETAGIIAADDFDMSRLKREPQDITDDDILGM